MREFLQTKIKTKRGKIIMSDGVVVGDHDGLAFYTIGQRHFGRRTYDIGLKTDERPLFVVDKKIKANQLVVGYEDDELLYKKEIEVGDVNWIAGHPPKFPLKCKVRLRHRQPLETAKIERLKDYKIIVRFEKPQRAVTPGQFAVIYKNNECIGGGVIR